MAKPLLAEELWERIEPLLPADRAKPKGGRPAALQSAGADRHLVGAAHPVVLRNFPQELGCGSGMTCWRRLRELASGRGVGKNLAGAARRTGTSRRRSIGRKWRSTVARCEHFLRGSKRAPIPRIAAKMARSGMLPAMVKAPRWRSPPHRRERPRLSSSNPADRRHSTDQTSTRRSSQAARRSLRRPRLTPKRKSASPCESTASRRSSPSEIRNTAVGWAFIGVSSSGSLVGCSNSAAFVYVTKNEMTSIPPS